MTSLKQRNANNQPKKCASPFTEDQLTTLLMAADSLKTLFKEPITIDNMLECIEDVTGYAEIYDTFECMPQPEKRYFTHLIRRLFFLNRVNVGDWIVDNQTSIIYLDGNLNDVVYEYFIPA